MSHFIVAHLLKHSVALYIMQRACLNSSPQAVNNMCAPSCTGQVCTWGYPERWIVLYRLHLSIWSLQLTAKHTTDNDGLMMMMPINKWVLVRENCSYHLAMLSAQTQVKCGCMSP